MKFTTSLALAALTSLTAAQDLKCLEHLGSPGPCLTSFAWCNHDPEPTCTYPEDTNPLDVDSTEIALYRGRKYNLSFNKLWEADSQVLIRWRFPSYNNAQNGLWATNISYSGHEATFEFDPEAMLADFPTPESNMTQAEATVAASESWGYIWISHANWEKDVLMTQKFVVLSANAGRVADAANTYARHQRKQVLGISLGVGLGVGIPLAILITWLIARPPAFLARRMKRKGSKPVATDDISMEWVEPTGR